MQGRCREASSFCTMIKLIRGLSEFKSFSRLQLCKAVHKYRMKGGYIPSLMQKRQTCHHSFTGFAVMPIETVAARSSICDKEPTVNLSRVTLLSRARVFYTRRSRIAHSSTKTSLSASHQCCNISPHSLQALVMPCKCNQTGRGEKRSIVNLIHDANSRMLYLPGLGS